MINFIICDDSNSAQDIKKVVDSYMMNYDIETKYYMFTDYEDFKEKIKDISGYKVFILNNNYQEVGIDEAVYVRKELDDWNSIIILTTCHNEFKYEVSDKRLFIFDYLSKTNFFVKNLKEDLECITKNYDNREKCLAFEINRIIKRIELDCINMISKEKDSKKCIIETSCGTYYVPETLLAISKRLDKRFLKINRSCIVNTDKILEYDLTKNKITLKNGVVSFDISRDYKKQLSNYISN